MGAYEQATSGKGKERHSFEGEDFADQQILQFGRWMGSNHWQCGQTSKKALESTRLSPEAAIQELFGAINYAAAAVILLQEEITRRDSKDDVQKAGR